MEVKRVKQILSSPKDIIVHYHGQSVWIDQCNDKDQTATIHLRGRHQDKADVPLAELEEQ